MPNGNGTTPVEKTPDATTATRSRRSRAEDATGTSTDALAWASRELRAHPALGGFLLGCAGLGAALVIGVGELAVGVALGYAGYLMLAKGESPVDALRDALALEYGEAPEGAARKKRAPGR